MDGKYRIEDKREKLMKYFKILSCAALLTGTSFGTAFAGCGIDMKNKYSCSWDLGTTCG